MPLCGYIRQFSSSKLLFRTLVAFIFFTFVSLVIPSDSHALVVYYTSGGQCRALWQEGPPNYTTHDDPVNNVMCNTNPPSSCQMLETERDGNCTSAKVPGVATANCSDDDLKVSYHRNGSGVIDGITWRVDCPSNVTWSESEGNDPDLQIDYLNPSNGEWESIRQGNVGHKGDYKISNGGTERTLYFDQDGWRDYLRDSNNRRNNVFNFVVFPSCAGEADEAIEHGCYRADYLDPVIEDFNAPSCSVTYVDQRGPAFNPKGFQVTVNMSDRYTDGWGGTGIGRMGLFLEPTGGGALIPIHDNDIRAPFDTDPPPETYTYQEFINENTLPNPAGNYQFVAKVWDWLGNQNYEAAGGGAAGEAASAANMQICKSYTTACAMPNVQVDITATCLKRPGSDNLSQIVGTAQNLSMVNRCPIEYVDISPNYAQNNPGYNESDAPYNSNSITIPVSGLGSKDLVNTELRYNDGSLLPLTEFRNYNVRYRGPANSPIQAVAYGTFSTPRYCDAPSAPDILATPICRIPYNPSVPTPQTQLLRWDEPFDPGDGFSRYESQVSTSQNVSGIIYTVHHSQISNTTWNVGSSVFAQSIPTGGSYYYRVRAAGGLGGPGPWSGWHGTGVGVGSPPGSAQLLRRMPYSTTLTASPNPAVPNIQLNWTYNNHPDAPVTTWNIARTGATSRSFSVAGSTLSVTDQTNIACVNSNYNYSITGTNVCGTGNATGTSATCHQNQPPTCGAMQYSVNNGANWFTYPDINADPNFVVRNAGTTMRLRRNCTDPEAASLSYRWVASCGTFSPSFIWNNNTTTYTFPGVPGVSCDVTSQVADSQGLRALDDHGIAETFPPAAVGTHSLAQSLTIRRLVGTEDDVYGEYQVINGVEQSNGRMIYRIRDYVNPTLANPNVNLPGTLTINTSVSTVGGAINLCRSDRANCTLSTSPGGTGKTATVTASDSNHNVNIIPNLNFAEHNLEVLNPDGTPKFAVRLDFFAERANPDESVSTTTTGVPSILNRTPSCLGLTFNPASPATSATGNRINVNLQAGDDWGLKGITSYSYAPTSNLANVNYLDGLTNTTAPNFFSSGERYGQTAGRTSWDIDGLASGTYRFFVTVTDLDGLSRTCTANVGVGTSNQGGSSSAYPQYVLARTPPTCNEIEYRDNSTSPWAVYPPPPGSIDRVRNSTITLRRVCTDTETITYGWTTSCGTVSPSNTSQTTYTYPNTNSANCDITSTARDTFFNYSPEDHAIATTPPAAVAGQHSMLAGRLIERLSSADQYATRNGVLQNMATLTYRIRNYRNPSAANTSVNLPGTITIDTTATTFRIGTTDKINICNGIYGKCVFASNNSTSITLNNIQTGSVVDSVINITFDTPAQLAAVKDVLQDTANTAVKYGVIGRFSATQANGSSVTTSAAGIPGIVNNPPSCYSVDFIPPSPYRGGNVDIVINARDDWGVKGLRVVHSFISEAGSTTLLNNPNLWSTLPRSGQRTVRWNTSLSSVVSNYYQFGIIMTDADGSSQFCQARVDDIEGDEIVGGDNLLPTVLVDKVPPVCDSFTTQLNSTNLTQLRFITAAHDPRSSGTYSGITGLTFSQSRGGGPFTPVVITTPPVIAGNPETYTFDRAVPQVWDVDLNQIPSGITTFRAQWRDRAGNLGFCTTQYEKGNRVSASVRMNVGPNADQPRDYVYEAGTGPAVPFRIVTRPSLTAGLTDAVISPLAGAQTAACRASYPGDPSSPIVCNGFFISGGAEFAATAPPIVELRFPIIPGTTRGKYNCRMNLIDNLNPSAPQVVRTATSAGTSGICRFTLASSELIVDTINPHGTTSRWPTHIEFEVFYNTNQVYGEVRNEAGNLVSGGTAVVQNSSGTNMGPAGTITGGLYSTPVSATNNSIDYPYSPATYAVDLNLPDPTKLCVWVTKTTNNDAERDEFGNLFLNTTSEAQRRAIVGNIARSLDVTGAGWTGGASPQCRVETKAFVRGPMSPKYENQVNFLHIPKVKITGEIHYINDVDDCVDTDLWDDPENQATGSVDLDLRFISTPDLAGTDDFDSPDEGATPGVARYQTGDTYTFYANMLPGASWNTWSIARDVDFPNAPTGRFIDCPINRSVIVRDRVSNYPETSEIIVPIAIAVPETNDWWQAYNGGVHAQNGLENTIPNVVANGEIEGQPDVLNRLIGNPTADIYETGPATRARIRAPFTSYYAGGLVSSTRGLGTITIADGGRNWRFAPTTAAGTLPMPEFRSPYTTADPNTELSAIENILGEDDWATSLADLPTSDKVFINGNATMNSQIQLGGAFKYLIVNGNLNINRNILNNSTTGSLFIVATGDVVISGGTLQSNGTTVSNPVSEINASIYTPRTITIRTADKDGLGERELKVYGGLYAGSTIETERDIANTVENFGLPSLQVIYNPALILNSKDSDFPVELKEANVYWIRE